MHRLRAARALVAAGEIGEGDVVEVTGAASREVAFDGLRETSAVLAFRDWPTIRKLPS